MGHDLHAENHCSRAPPSPVLLQASPIIHSQKMTELGQVCFSHYLPHFSDGVKKSLFFNLSSSYLSKTSASCVLCPSSTVAITFMLWIYFLYDQVYNSLQPYTLIYALLKKAHTGQREKKSVISFEHPCHLVQHTKAYQLFTMFISQAIFLLTHHKGWAIAPSTKCSCSLVTIHCMCKS